MSEIVEPSLLSDFDRTATEVFLKTGFRSLIKNPFPIRAGYLEFLLGAKEGGVQFDGFVSRRPSTLPSRIATAHSLARLGLSQHFPDHGIVLAGSEVKKAEEVAKESGNRVVGMLEDNSFRFGMALLGVLNNSANVAGERRNVVLGAVHYPNSQQYIGQLAKRAAMFPDVDVQEDPNGIHIAGASFDVRVVALEPYSVEAGQQFANILTDLNKARQLVS